MRKEALKKKSVEMYGLRGERKENSVNGKDNWKGNGELDKWKNEMQ